MTGFHWLVTIDTARRLFILMEHGNTYVSHLTHKKVELDRPAAHLAILNIALF